MSPPAAAALWRRAGAAVVDGAVGLIAWSLGSLWLVISIRALHAGEADLGTVLVAASGVVLLAVALHAVYHVGFVWGCGQTPGRMAFGIAVVRRDGAPAGFRRAFLRVLGGSCAALTLGLLSLVTLFSRHPGGFGDWLAGTRVVRSGR